MGKETKNPLQRYLKKNGITQEEFAHQLGLVRGHPVTQPQIAAWSTGKTDPSQVTIRFIESATAGKVTDRAWKIYRANRG